MIRLTPLQKRYIGKIIPFGLIWMFFGMLYSLVQKGLLGNLTIYPSTGNPYEFKTSLIMITIGSLILGMIMGAIEGFFLNQRFKKVSFGYKVFIKVGIYVFAICFFLILLTLSLNSVRLRLPLFNSVITESVRNFIWDFSFWSVVIYMSVVMMVTLFISEVSENLGVGVLMNFITGKYHSPTEEKRIFMFLDMKSSTTIAEKLGHVKYYQLLNDYYADMTDEILRSEGEIYQYVGDEIIVSWSMKKGLWKSYYLKCFFRIRSRFEKISHKYQYRYDVIPKFKAGIHFGTVTAGEIGIVKKEIVFTGDVLNTTARIQGLCNEYKVDLLVSQELLALSANDNMFQIKEIGLCELRGKEESIQLMTVEMA